MKHSIKIIFDKNDLNPVFYPTEMLSGSVEFSIDEAIKARSLTLTVKGKTKVFWSESKYDHYSGLEEHMNYTNNFIGSGELGELHEITAGMHTFRFKCQIPEDVPATVVRDRGFNVLLNAFIQYKVKLTLDVPLKRNIVEEREFTVKREEDLNLIPECDKVCEFQESLQLANLCCKTSMVQLKVKLPKCGYALKEEIPFTIEVVSTDQKCPIKKIKVHLLRLKVCLGQKPCEKLMTEVQIAAKTTVPFVAENDFLHIKSSIEVPDTCPISNLKYGKLYHTTYILEFSFLSDGCEKSASIGTPIAIGTVPIRRE